MAQFLFKLYIDNKMFLLHLFSSFLISIQCMKIFPFVRRRKKHHYTTIISIWQEISSKKTTWHYSIQLLGQDGALEMTLLSQIRWPNIWFQMCTFMRAFRVLKWFSEMHCWGLSYLRQERNSFSKFAAWMIFVDALSSLFPFAGSIIGVGKIYWEIGKLYSSADFALQPKIKLWYLEIKMFK